MDECAQLLSLLAESVQFKSPGSVRVERWGLRWWLGCGCFWTYLATWPALVGAARGEGGLRQWHDACCIF